MDEKNILQILSHRWAFKTRPFDLNFKFSHDFAAQRRSSDKVKVEEVVVFSPSASINGAQV